VVITPFTGTHVEQTAKAVFIIRETGFQDPFLFSRSFEEMGANFWVKRLKKLA
jgi:hypothetical protein